jgi:hypothetical protein
MRINGKILIGNVGFVIVAAAGALRARAPSARNTLRRSAGSVYPVSGADLGNPNSNADYFLLSNKSLSDSLLSDFLPSNFLPSDFLPSDFLPSDTFVSVHLTARRNHARHKTRCGRDRLRNHAGRVDPIFLAHTGGNRCLGRLRVGESYYDPLVAADPQNLAIALHAVLVVHEHLIALGLGAGELDVAVFAVLVAGERRLELRLGAAAPQLEPLPEALKRRTIRASHAQIFERGHRQCIVPRRFSGIAVIDHYRPAHGDLFFGAGAGRLAVRRQRRPAAAIAQAHCPGRWTAEMCEEKNERSQLRCP